VHIPEVLTGLIGAGFIGLAVLTSVLANKRERVDKPSARL
jgi:uncharacterized protein